MRNYIASLILLMVSSTSFAQVTAQSEKIAIFIKVWGYVKYYHPRVASGRINWDSVFVSNVKSISRSKNKGECNKQLNKIIAAAGRESVVSQAADDSLFTSNYVSSLLWIDHSAILNSQIKARLKHINKSTSLHFNKYVSIAHSTADYSGENKYENIGFPGEAYRLLFLSRFWNIINYYAPYKYLTGESWDIVLTRFIPRFIAANDSVSYYKVLLELGKSLYDGHCQLSKSYQTAEINDLIFGKYTVPFYCDILEDTLVVRKLANDSICRKAGIQKGDIILKADNIPVKRLMESRRKYISASNKSGESHFLSWLVLDGQTPKVTLTVKRGNKTFTTTLQRTSNAQKNWGDLVNYTADDAGYKNLGDSILLIYAMQIWDGNLDTLKSMIHNSKSVIFDVRNYPHNDTFYSIVDPFLSEPAIINFITAPVANNPGKFNWVQSPKIGRRNMDVFKGKVVILADERTQSQGEYSCMVLQTIPQAVTIGSQTAGADGVVTFIPLGGNLTLSYSGYGMYYPDKGQTQRSGIRIDIKVEKTVQEVKSGTDETLERALKYLREGLEL